MHDKLAGRPRQTPGPSPDYRAEQEQLRKANEAARIEREKALIALGPHEVKTAKTVFTTWHTWNVTIEVHRRGGTLTEVKTNPVFLGEDRQRLFAQAIEEGILSSLLSPDEIQTVVNSDPFSV